MVKKFVLVFAGFLVVFFLSRDYVAREAWHRFGADNAALRLSRDPELAFRIGQYYFNGGAYDLDRAEVAYKKTLSIDPKYFLANYQLARVLFVKGQTETALDAINRELEINPENLRSLYVRGLIFGFAERLEEAADDFRRFTQWAPGEWAGWNDLAWALSKAEKYEEAYDALEDAFLSVPEAEKNAWLQNAFGVALLNLGRHKDADAAFSRARELADNMTIDDWRRAYPGNSAESAERGFAAFRAALEANLFKTRYLDN